MARRQKPPRLWVPVLTCLIACLVGIVTMLLFGAYGLLHHDGSVAKVISAFVLVFGGLAVMLWWGDKQHARKMEIEETRETKDER